MFKLTTRSGAVFMVLLEKKAVNCFVISKMDLRV